MPSHIVLSHQPFQPLIRKPRDHGADGDRLSAAPIITGARSIPSLKTKTVSLRRSRNAKLRCGDLADLGSLPRRLSRQCERANFVRLYRCIQSRNGNLSLFGGTYPWRSPDDLVPAFDAIKQADIRGLITCPTVWLSRIAMSSPG